MLPILEDFSPEKFSAVISITVSVPLILSIST